MSRTISILGCGWLGKPLAVSLLASGYSVKGSTTREENLAILSQLGIMPYRIDLAAGPETFADFFTCDYLIVSIPPRRKSGDEATFLSHIGKTAKLAVQAGVSTVIFLSSSSVYRGQTGGVTEDLADRGSLLFRAERLFLETAGLSTVVIRFVGLVGPLRHPARFLSGKVVVGADDPVNLIHQRDCISILVEVIRQDLRQGIYNACSRSHPTKEVFYSAACRAAGIALPVFLEPRNNEGRYVISDRIRRDLGYTFVYDDPMSMDF